MKPGMLLYREELGMLLMMTVEDAGEAIRLLARRFLRDIEPQTDNERIADFLASALPKLDKDIAEYDKKVSAGQTGGRQSASKRQAQSKQNSSTSQAQAKHTTSTSQAEAKQEPSTSQQNIEQGTIEQGTKNIEQGIGRAFRPPTVEEVRQYCQERGNWISAERFVDHYAANGWRVGKAPMKDWKAAVRNWEKNEYKGQQSNKPLSDGDFVSHNWDYDKLQAIAESRIYGGAQ